jgi:hypothetical protein
VIKKPREQGGHSPLWAAVPEMMMMMMMMMIIIIIIIYLVQVSYMLQLYTVVIRLATREKINTQFPK